jgi:hypothetical protein
MFMWNGIRVLIVRNVFTKLKLYRITVQGIMTGPFWLGNRSVTIHWKLAFLHLKSCERVSRLCIVYFWFLRDTECMTHYTVRQCWYCSLYNTQLSVQSEWRPICEMYEINLHSIISISVSNYLDYLLAS